MLAEAIYGEGIFNLPLYERKPRHVGAILINLTPNLTFTVSHARRKRNALAHVVRLFTFVFI